MKYTRKKLGSLAAAAALYGASATPAHADFWSDLWSFVSWTGCAAGCGVYYTGNAASCESATEFLSYGCILAAPTRTVQQNTDCFADTGDFRNACYAAASYEERQCETNCV